MGPFQDFDTLLFGSLLTWQGFLTGYLSPPCWMMQSWRMSSFAQKAFHPLMNRPMTTCLMINLPHMTISSSLSIIIPFIQHTHTTYTPPPPPHPQKKKKKKKKQK